jgi:hypothetical protein
MTSPEDIAPAVEQVAAALEGDRERPWCVHRVAEEVLQPWKGPEGARADLVDLARIAADVLVREGKVRSEPVSATAIGAHCEDLLIWSPHCEAEHLADFGPDYEVPFVLQRLVSHFECHGL